jgi:hypothetical protein
VKNAALVLLGILLILAVAGNDHDPRAAIEDTTRSEPVQ